MIRDRYLRILFIPLLGMMIPAVSGIISYSLYSILEIIAANIYFILTSFCIWRGSNWIHSKLRNSFRAGSNPFFKIASLCAICLLYGNSIGTILSMIWFYISKDHFAWSAIYKFNILCALAITVFTLVYEILFLSKERELDTKIVKQLDRERSQAELEVLRNELDPHFIFNSLNTLNHLILNNQQKAYAFNNKLAQVYKYFLLNKHNELISLSEELEFIDSYVFLLQIRHDDKLNLQTEFNDQNERVIMIPPLALQILVENAIKHNEFNHDNPLGIKIVMNNHYLKVSNNVRPKNYLVNSTGIGLKNLSLRYRILCNKDIVIENTDKEFIVKLPFIEQQEP
ncbi:MAG TPA: histidine kinase [Chitinophagaceae bacterium]|nr:histidine kinase [Chitinophagaceae bacterium]